MNTLKSLRLAVPALLKPNLSMRSRLIISSCVLFTGILAFRQSPPTAQEVSSSKAPVAQSENSGPSTPTVSPAALSGASATTTPSDTLIFNDTLFRTAGSIRRAGIDLYRAQRSLISTQEKAEAEAKAKAEVAKGQSSTGKSSAAPAGSQSKASGTSRSAQPAQTAQSTPVDQALEMRVAIIKGVDSIAMGTSTPGRMVDSGGHGTNFPAQTSYLAEANSQGMTFGNWQMTSSVWVEATQGGLVYVGDRWYRGRVLLLNREGQLWVVNYVVLRDYLASVVGSEMYPDWPLEALKAQAVAARSYALTHHLRPASSDYDLDNTQRYQVYSGISREAQSAVMAVEATKGEFISYQGGVVESLYAASDQIVEEAHGGQGMSQTGAMELASRGYTYRQILSNYYPGTGLTRLEVH